MVIVFSLIILGEIGEWRSGIREREKVKGEKIDENFPFPPDPFRKNLFNQFDK
jgi:hypothetical protein